VASSALAPHVAASRPYHRQTRGLVGSSRRLDRACSAFHGRLNGYGKTIDGKGQYDGMFDLNACKGYVIIDGPSADLVLANFVRQVFTHLIIAHGGVILHGACVVKNGNAHIFYGTSGAGKSTICELSSDCIIASDDLTAIRKIGSRFLAWGMPGTGMRIAECGLRNSLGPYRIRAIFRLVQDTENRLIQLEGAKAVADILALPRTPVESARITKMLEFLDELTDHVQSYELHFRKDTSFWKCIEEVLGS